MFICQFLLIFSLSFLDESMNICYFFVYFSCTLYAVISFRVPELLKESLAKPSCLNISAFYFLGHVSDLRCFSLSVTYLNFFGDGCRTLTMLLNPTTLDLCRPTFSPIYCKFSVYFFDSSSGLLFGIHPSKLS